MNFEVYNYSRGKLRNLKNYIKQNILGNLAHSRF